ncbi:hypothetical protein RB195_019856 [Necator americanus]|uniref:Uncharacterized protein n=1 Tax=Necator americanus TaxID=51031 RepID=A0ABR1CG34_NECAM
MLVRKVVLVPSLGEVQVLANGGKMKTTQTYKCGVSEDLALGSIEPFTIAIDSKPQEMKWSFILFFVALICAGVFEAAAAGDKKGSINRPWMGGFPTDSPQ